MGRLFLNRGNQSSIEKTDSECNNKVRQIFSQITSPNNSTQMQCESGSVPEGVEVLQINPGSPVIARNLPHFEDAYLLSSRN
mmetsp:Transcript_12740/g.16103  ORF Transcript_12740/g.16103 Transcript_12740/m.16103 type:complete len:82 (-) Transcript_12740:289-534(-)